MIFLALALGAEHVGVGPWESTSFWFGRRKRLTMHARNKVVIRYFIATMSVSSSWQASILGEVGQCGQPHQTPLCALFECERCMVEHGRPSAVVLHRNASVMMVGDCPDAL